MTRHLARSAVLFVVALVALSTAAYTLQQTVYRRATVQDLTPTLVAPQMAAPVVATARSRAGVPQVDPGWLRRTAARSGVPETALRAYARAELMSADSCGIGWTTLAGIGWVESQHATLGGRTLGADGHASSRILGPALDGREGFRAIAASPESTVWHGDPQWDHAVGPMQFIPTTWEAWSSDGDGDGVADPNDIDDAALAAARYLCAGGRNLTTAEGWSGGVLSYNQAQEYVDAVHAAATSYSDRTT